MISRTIYDHQAITIKDSPRNSSHRKGKQTKPRKYRQYLNHRRRKGKKVESNIDSAAHN
jgi:hypothetical protein